MPASHIASQTGTNTLTLPAHQAGDLFIAMAARSGSSTPPTIPVANGWAEEFPSNGANSLGFAVASLKCDSSSETCGTFSNATGLTVLLYRPASGYSIDVGDVKTALSGNSDTVSSPTLDFEGTGGTSWVVSIMAHRTTTLTGLSTPPAGMTNRVAFTGNVMAASDTAGPVNGWTAQSVTYTGTPGAYRSFTIEIVVTKDAVASKNFYMRTNYRDAGTRFFRTNDLNAAGIRAPSATVSGSGVTFATVIGANINTTNRSGFYNLDFTPVAGDLLSFQTRLNNSTITLSPDGTFVISPATDGIFQRRARDVSAGTWFQDAITLADGTGTGVVTSPQATSSGAGVVSAPRSGVGLINGPAATVSGTGSIATVLAIKRTMVNKFGAYIANGTQMRCLVLSSLNPGYTTYVNGTYTVGANGLLVINDPALPAIGTSVILLMYAAGVSSSGDQDLGMSARRVFVVDVNS